MVASSPSPATCRGWVQFSENQTYKSFTLTFNLQARTLVIESDGIEQTRAFAQLHVDRAAQAIANFPESEAKNGLLKMCNKVMERRK